MLVAMKMVLMVVVLAWEYSVQLVVWIWMMLNALQVAGSEDEWLEKQIESEKSISELEQQIRQLKVSMHVFVY